MAQTPNTYSQDVVTLVIKHRIKVGMEDAYESWLRRIVGIAGQSRGHLGVDVIRSEADGLRLFTCVLRFHSTDAMQNWLDSDQRRQLIREAEPMLADGDQTEINPHKEFWFNPASERSPEAAPRWKQVVVSYIAILPLTSLVPLAWQPLLSHSPFWSGYLASNTLITLTIVLLVVYLMMPLATRVFAPWLTAGRNSPEGQAEQGQSSHE